MLGLPVPSILPFLPLDVPCMIDSPSMMRRAWLTVAVMLVLQVYASGAIAQPPDQPSVQPSDEPSDSVAVQDGMGIAADIGTPSDQVRLLLLAAHYAHTTGRLNDGQTYRQAAIDLANHTDDHSLRVRLLLSVAEWMAEHGMSEQALALMHETEAIAPTLADPLAQADAYQAIASLYADVLEPAQSAAALSHALAAIRNEPPTEAQSLAFTSIAFQFAALGHPETANRLIAKSQDVLIALRMQQESDPLLSPTPWVGNLGLLGTLFSGERTQATVTLSGGARRQWEHDAVTFSARLTYDFDADREDTDEFSGQALTDGIHYFSDDLQYFVNSSVESDNLENLNLRARLTTGLGVNLWQAEGDRRLDLRLGLGARYENFVNEDTTFNPITTSVGLNYQDKWFSILAFRQSLTVDIPVDNASDYLFQAQTELGIPISNQWSLSNTARLTLSGDPPDANPGLLFNLQTGLRYEF